MPAIQKAVSNPPFPAEAARRELQAVLASRVLRDSGQLRTLLHYVVEETIAGREEGLKEYSLGLAVFHRSNNYDPRTDSIVRVQASLLRKRLAQYYATEGTASGLRLNLPKGAYVPTLDAVPEPVVPQPTRREFWPLAYGGAGAFLGGAGVWVATRKKTVVIDSAAKASECPELWGHFLASKLPATVSYGVPFFFVADPGFYVRDVRVNRESEATKAGIFDIEKKLGKRLKPHDDVYIGSGEAEGLLMLNEFLRDQKVSTTIANSHYLGVSDIQDRNLIVISSSRFQTLLGGMTLPERFGFDGTGAGSYVNEEPRPGEPARYEAGSVGGIDVAYAVVSLWPGPNPNTRMLSLSGSHTWATLAAAEYVLNGPALRHLHEQLAKDGKGPEFFQVLIKSEGKNNRMRNFQYVTHRRLG